MARIRKALIAGAGSLVAGLLAAGVAKGGIPGAAEIGAALGVAVATGWTAYRVPNKPAQPEQPAA